MTTAPTRTAEARAEFAAVTRQVLDQRNTDTDPEMRRLFSAYITDLYAALKKASPRARVKREPSYDEHPWLETSELHRRLEKIGAEARVDANTIAAKHNGPLKARSDALYAEFKALRERLNELAPLAEIRRTGLEGEWRYLDLRSASDYNSQGFSALHYAEGSVQLTADVARAEGFVDGVDLVVLRVPYYGESAWLAAVRVESDLDADIIRRSPPPSLREQVRLCWKRGVNPRVFNPFLPHGYEEQAGLDYFGRDLRAS